MVITRIYNNDGLEFKIKDHYYKGVKTVKTVSNDKSINKILNYLNKNKITWLMEQYEETEI